MSPASAHPCKRIEDYAGDQVLHSATAFNDVVTVALCVALVVTALALIANPYVSMSRGAQDRATGKIDSGDAYDLLRIVVRPLPTS